MKEVKGIGFTIPSNNENDYLSIDSFSSLSETDIAIFCPNLDSSYTSDFFYENRKYEGKELYNQESSTKIKEHIKHWNKELLNFVANGGTLFVVLCERQDFFIHTGTKDVSGTGRNQKVTNHVMPLSNYDFLPFPNIEYHSSVGQNVLSKNSNYDELSRQFSDLLSYKVYLKSEKIPNATFSTKKGDKILGANLKMKEGYLIFIPDINLDTKEHTNFDEKEDSEHWNEEGLKRGKIFVNCLVQIDKVLRSHQIKSPKPDWINRQEYELQEVFATRKAIQENTKEIEFRTEQNKELFLVLEEQESLKDLLFETGKQLENAVIKALKILGYSAENYDDGELELDQIIISPEGDRFIGECEGKESKAIDVTKFRQLLDGLNADYEREEVREKAYGLLFGNPERQIKPADRTLDFTQKCKTGANREKIGLIRTSDLFEICRYIQENNDTKFASKCRQVIKNQLGKVIVFPEIKNKKTGLKDSSKP